MPFGPLIEFNPETDEPPVLEPGQKVQVWLRCYTWPENEMNNCLPMSAWNWTTESICAYRIWTEPKFETVRLRGYEMEPGLWGFGNAEIRALPPLDTHTLDLPTLDGDRRRIRPQERREDHRGEGVMEIITTYRLGHWIGTPPHACLINGRVEDSQGRVLYLLDHDGVHLAETNIPRAQRRKEQQQ